MKILIIKLLRMLGLNKNIALRTRDITKPFPQIGFCLLCGRKEKVCTCKKHNCQCNINASDCSWPSCICDVCLETKCVCK